MSASNDVLLLKLEHAKKLAEFLETKNPETALRIQEIENELGMSGEDIAKDVIEHYLKGYA